MMPPLKTRAAALRDLTAKTLIRQRTIAGERVEQERTLPLEPGELPHLNVAIDESAEPQYQGGPRFLMTGQLQIKGTVQRARLADALSDLDALVYQVKDALWCDGPWLALANQVLSFNAKATFKSDENQHLGEVMITMGCQWLETVTIRGAGPLAGENLTINVGSAAITQPLTAITNFPSS
jgi:hypothetical protein